MIRLRATASAAFVVPILLASPLDGQTVRGRVVEAGTDRAVASAGLLLLGPDSVPVSSALADSLGRFSLPVPEDGEYYLAAERIGYSSALSPLLELSDSSTYQLVVELEIEPVRLEGVEVRVRPEAMERWLTLRSQIGNPNQYLGYRAVYGARIEEARRGARDNTDFLRRLFIPVHHGREVCIRGRYGCMPLYVDDRYVPPELIESVELARIVAVVILPVSRRGYQFHLFTRDFRFDGAGR